MGNLATGRVGLAETHLLDAGCGTGSFAAALAPHVGRLTLIDASHEMLDVARAKLAGTRGAPHVDLHAGQLQALPFEDASFDAVMINQVLHHLDEPPGDQWPEHGRVLGELARVLRPGGVLTVNTTSHEQIRHGWWAFSLIPEAIRKLCRRYAPLEVLEALAQSNGMTITGRFVPTDATIQRRHVLRRRGPPGCVVATGRLDVVAGLRCRAEGHDRHRHRSEDERRAGCLRRRARRPTAPHRSDDVPGSSRSLVGPPLVLHRSSGRRSDESGIRFPPRPRWRDGGGTHPAPCRVLSRRRRTPMTISLPRPHGSAR